MSTLDKLKLVTAKRPAALPPTLVRRNKLIAKLSEQAAMVQAAIKGEKFNCTRYKKVIDNDGNTKTIEVEKRVKRWSYTGDDGKLYLTVRYGNKLIELAKNKQAIEVGDNNGLLKTIDLLKHAVESGELDTQIANVANFK